MSTELLACCGNVVVERFAAEAFCFDEKSPKTTHKQQRAMVKMKNEAKWQNGVKFSFPGVLGMVPGGRYESRYAYRI